MTRTIISAAALAAAIAPIPGNLEGSQRRLVYEMMELRSNPAFTAAPERYQHHLLPRRREMGDIPPFLEFED